MKYSYKIFDNIDEECKKIWTNTENFFSCTFFQDINFIEELVENTDNKLKIVVIFCDKQVIAIFPLEIKKYFFINVLQWIGTEYADYSNPVLSKNFHTNYDKKLFLNIWAKIIEELKPNLDLIFFNNQLEKIDDFNNPFVESFKTINFSKIYNIDFQGEFNDYQENIKKKDKNHAYEIHRTLIKYEKLKKISENIGVEIKDSYSDTIDIEKIIEEKKDQLYKKNIPNKLSSQFKKIFKNLIKSKKINFYSISLMANGQAISKCFGFVYLNTYYYYIPTILPNSFSSYKPGKILIIEIIQWCIKNKIKKFDFGLGSEKYKKHFSNKELNLHRYINFYSLKGSIAFILILLILKIKKLWL